jgi:molybdopterin synthase sulfur carrier subunit
VEAETLGNLCDVLTDAHPDFARVRQQCSYLVNEVASHGDPYSVELQPGDRVDVLPPFAGGSQ